MAFLGKFAKLQNLLFHRKFNLMKLLILHPFLSLVSTTLSCHLRKWRQREGDDKGNVTVLQETEEISLGKCQAYVNSL